MIPDEQILKINKAALAGGLGAIQAQLSNLETDFFAAKDEGALTEEDVNLIVTFTKTLGIIRNRLLDEVYEIKGSK